jgi:hypothetical protein
MPPADAGVTAAGPRQDIGSGRYRDVLATVESLGIDDPSGIADFEGLNRVLSDTEERFDSEVLLDPLVQLFIRRYTRTRTRSKADSGIRQCSA